MAEQRANSFSAFLFTEAEQEEAVKLNALQEMYFQNMHAETAEILLSLKFDPKEMFIFAQQEAYYRGQLELLAFLIAQDATIKRRVETRRREEEQAAAAIQQTTNGA